MVVNFGAGPAKLPKEVLVEVQKNIINHEGTGLSVMEMSHRSASYAKIHNEAIEDLRKILKVPDNYKIIFMQGGGTGAFASICMNLINRTGVADYIVTGSWSSKAAKEAAQYGKVNLVLPKTNKYISIPPQDTWQLDPNASFVYYCDNETIEGVEFNFIPSTNGIPLVCDMSSNFLSRPFDVSKFGIVFAGAQKNFGPSGITVVIVREDLIGHQMKETPSILDYSIAAKNNSIYNTPPTFIIYVVGQVFKWIQRQGGIEGMLKYSKIKSTMIYDLMMKKSDFYFCPVEKNARSRMNIPFRIGRPEGDEALEQEFLKIAESKGLLQLKGHRSVGGIRASLYNAITVAETKELADLMEYFYVKNQK